MRVTGRVRAICSAWRPPRHVHPLGEGVEARPALVQGDDLAVEEEVLVGVGQPVELREGRRDVALGAGLDA